jgi:hypothetical protein
VGVVAVRVVHHLQMVGVAVVVVVVVVVLRQYHLHKDKAMPIQ